MERLGKLRFDEAAGAGILGESELEFEGTEGAERSVSAGDWPAEEGRRRAGCEHEQGETEGGH